jgi:hypothetical protein
MAQADYFPLQTGNQWVYRSNGPVAVSVFTVEVKQPQTFNGKSYFLVEGFPEQNRLWLRTDEAARVWMWDADARMESIWIDFAAQPPGVFKPGSDPCASNAAIESRDWKYSGPVGEFNNALSVKYMPGSCADAGLERDVFLPWVGMVQRTSQTIAGPRIFDLIYARLGSTVVSGGEAGFSLTLDQAVYTANLMPPVDPRRATPTAVMRLTVRHAGREPLVLDFSSSQRFNIVIYNSDGKEVYNWAATRLFLAVTGRETVQGEKSWVEAIPLAQGDRPLPAGRYVAVAELKSEGKPFSATVTFEIRHVF